MWANDRVFAAFKILPIDPTRLQQATGSILEPVDELSDVENCKEAVDLMVESIVKARQDLGAECQPDFVVQEAVVR